MSKPKTKSEKAKRGEEIGKKLLQSVQEMKAGKAVRATPIAPNEVAAARMKIGFS